MVGTGPTGLPEFREGERLGAGKLNQIPEHLKRMQIRQGSGTGQGQGAVNNSHSTRQYQPQIAILLDEIDAQFTSKPFEFLEAAQDGQPVQMLTFFGSPGSGDEFRLVYEGSQSGVLTIGSTTGEVQDEIDSIAGGILVVGYSGRYFFVFTEWSSSTPLLTLETTLEAELEKVAVKPSGQLETGRAYRVKPGAVLTAGEWCSAQWVGSGIGWRLIGSCRDWTAPSGAGFGRGNEQPDVEAPGIPDNSGNTYGSTVTSVSSGTTPTWSQTGHGMAAGSTIEIDPNDRTTGIHSELAAVKKPLQVIGTPTATAFEVGDADGNQIPLVYSYSSVPYRGLVLIPLGA